LVLAKASGDYLDDIRPDVRVVDLDAQRLIVALPGLVKYLRQERPQALLSSPAHANVIAVMARSLAGSSTRIVIREANTVSKIRAHTERFRERVVAWAIPWAYPFADDIVAVSDGVSTDLQQALDVDEEAITTIYNPTDIDELRRKAEKPVGHPWLKEKNSRFPVLLGMGRLSEQKDFGTLIRALHKVRDRYPARLIILGKGSQRKDLEDLAHSLGIGDAVSFPGFVDNPYAFLQRADVFVLSSAWEGMPNALIEAFVLGTLLVSTDCPSGPREILEDGKWGELVPVGDAHAMSEAIRRVIETPQPTVEEASRDRSTDRFRIEDVGRQYLALLTKEGQSA